MRHAWAWRREGILKVREREAPYLRGDGGRWLAGLGLALAPFAAARLYREVLERKPDPEGGEDICAPMGESAGYVESFDGSLSYTEELGTGPAIVLIPGWFNNTDSWHYQKKELSKRYRVISYDQRGQRYSAVEDNGPITLDSLARDLKAVLEARVPSGPVALCGHSMGGMAILKFAELFGGELRWRIKAVALIDTSCEHVSRHISGGGAVGVLREPVIAPVFRWIIRHPVLADRVKYVLTHTSLFLAATRAFGYGSSDSLVQLEYIGDMADQTSMKGASQAALGLLDNTCGIGLDALRDSRVPVLIWVGEKDRLTRPEASRRMAADLPDSELHIVRRAGHPSYMEAYREFNHVLDDFVTRALGLP